ncbi:MAG: hypothetical protein Q9183_003907 [Haloplaca sp. 2 TL-2023]
MVLQAIRYSRGQLEILDQLQLPYEDIYLPIHSTSDAWDAIKSMKVRGAPAIALVAALSVAVTVSQNFQDLSAGTAIKAANNIISLLRYLVTSRPTAVNLADAAVKLKALVIEVAHGPSAQAPAVLNAYLEAAEQMLVDDVQDNERIGRHGAEWIRRNKILRGSERKVSVITHCNTGSLATAGYGTALGIVRSLHAAGSLRQVFYTETRPYNQGSRLTGYELIHDGIPATLITDSMAGTLLDTKRKPESIAAVIVGADRVASNGDTANKVGTYTLAVLARYHDVKFLVAAPRTTIDMKTKTGADIVIEERPEIEVLNIRGPPVRTDPSGEVQISTDTMETVRVAARGTRAWNPAFDVTPAELIDGIVTERGVVEKDEHGVFQWDNVPGDPLGDVQELDEPKPLKMSADGITVVEPPATAK